MHCSKSTHDCDRHPSERRFAICVVNRPWILSEGRTLQVKGPPECNLVNEYEERGVSEYERARV